MSPQRGCCAEFRADSGDLVHENLDALMLLLRFSYSAKGVLLWPDWVVGGVRCDVWTWWHW